MDRRKRKREIKGYGDERWEEKGERERGRRRNSVKIE